MTLTDAAHSVWAKSVFVGDRYAASATNTETAVVDEDSSISHWLPLHQHLDDTGAIAALLWDRGFWAPSIRRRLSKRFDGDEGAARALVRLMGATHDVGKASPAFAVQVPILADAMTRAGLRVDPALAGHPDRPMVRHELVSYLAFSSWARDRGARIDEAQQLAGVLASHHGRPFTSGLLREMESRPRFVGTGAWETVRIELLDRAAAHPDVAPHLETILSAPLRQTDLVLLSGMLIIADWIASNDEFFPLIETGRTREFDTEQRAREAWHCFSPAESWRPDPDFPDTDAMFRARFQLPEGAAPHPAQQQFVELARSQSQPSLLILEAPMGSGKTEAALAAAEILAAEHGANGVFIALPTQATSDGMFSRVREWADRAGFDTSIFLAHGRSSLNVEFDTLVQDSFRSIDSGSEGAARADGEDARRRCSGSVIVHRWFAGSKKGPLSSLVVGTIDQVLFGALQSRHLALRHLALAGKVVVIDEAHAFDTFMGEFLECAVEWLGAYGVPTIILSATLPAQRRRALVRAYEKGRRSDSGLRPSRNPEAAAAFDGELDGDIGYPALIASGEKGAQVKLPGWTGRRRLVELERLDDELDTLSELLRERLAEGGCAVVIRNVVRRAQETAEHLRGALPGIPITLAHSRYLAEDRARKDRSLLDLFGSPARSAGRRPERAIVVATQVIEQSLDLDFDLMISDIAPIDLLLQRSGRLHRHDRPLQDRPAAVRTPRFVITGVGWREDPPALDRGASRIYGDHLLLRTLAELRERDHLSLPDDIAPAVQRVYGEHTYEPASWKTAFEKAHEKFRIEQQEDHDEALPYRLNAVPHLRRDLNGWAARSAGDAEADERKGRAAVRRSSDSLEVFALFGDPDVELRTAPWWDGGTLIPLSGELDRSLIREILGSVISIPEHECQQYGIDSLITDLEGLSVNENQRLQQSRDLRGELMVVFDTEGRCRLPRATLHYSERDGLRMEHLA